MIIACRYSASVLMLAEGEETMLTVTVNSPPLPAPARHLANRMKFIVGARAQSKVPPITDIRPPTTQSAGMTHSRIGAERAALPLYDP